MIFEWDDFGANHVISDQCQSHDCRDQLDNLHILNPAFKCTLFAIPGEMTMELLDWCKANKSWIELAQHGFFHTSNYECEKMTYEQFDELMHSSVTHRVQQYFVNGFRAPGWQISDDIYRWLQDNGWWVADQSYNDDRRPEMKAYINYPDGFIVVNPKWAKYDESLGVPFRKAVEAYHGHTWNVGWNGIYEDWEKVESLVRETTEFKFVSELFND